MTLNTLWIDTDIALGADKGDVDDGWALATLLCAATGDRDNTRILGVSACDGNTDADTAYHCASELLAALKIADCPLMPASRASSAIAQLPAGSTLVALGPLSHVAAALALAPDLPQRVRLVTVGGVLRWWRLRRRLSDLNIHRDRQAAALVYPAFSAALHCPLDVVDRLQLDGARLARIGQRNPAGHYLATHTARWLKQARWRHGRAAFPVWDLVAALAALDRLPGMTVDAQNRLTGFDVDAAWEGVELLLV